MTFRWMEQSVQKPPLDLWMYQEIIFDTHPEWIIECGSGYGGSALFLASVCQLKGRGRVITIDIAADLQVTVSHPLLTVIHGNSVDTEVVDEVRSMVGGEPAMLVLDSDHSKDHVLAELDAYHGLVHSGHYIVVEDTNTDAGEHRGGPMVAVMEFLRNHPEFYQDRDRERYCTLHPGGYLRRE